MATSNWLTNSTLQKNIGAAIAKNTVFDLIEQIDEAINVRHSAGGNAVEITLPLQIIINNLPLAHAQALVYSELILTYSTPEERGGKGFPGVYFKQPNSSVAPVLRIEWNNLLTDEEFDERKKIINDARWEFREDKTRRRG